MANTKSLGYRVLELAAVLLSVGCLGMLGYKLYSSQLRAKPRPAPPPNPALVAVTPPVNPAPAQISRRGPFHDVDIGELKWMKTQVGETDTLPLVDDAQLKGVVIRHLGTYTSTLANVFLFSPDGRHAVSIEHNNANTDRVAVWDLETGKIVRFCGHELGRQVAEFSEPERVYLDFNRLRKGAFSPDGKTFASRQDRFYGSELNTVFGWEVATGKLLFEIYEPTRLSDIFQFTDNEHLVTALWLPSYHMTPVSIHAATGEMEMLRPVSSARQIYSVAGREGLVVVSDHFRTGIVRLADKEFAGLQSIHPIQPILEIEKYPSEPKYVQMWFSTDGTHLFGLDQQFNALDTWDVAQRKRLRTVPFEGPAISDENLYPLPSAGLIVHRGPRSVQFLDIETGKARSRLRFPFAAGSLADVSADGRRIAVHTDQQSILVLEFPREYQRVT